MNKTFSVLAMILTTLAAFGSASAEGFSASGTISVGSPVAFAVIDSCGNGGATEGLDSNCFAVPSVLAGAVYSLEVTGATAPSLALSVCFYDGLGDFMSCDPGSVPAGAATAGVASLGGADVSWLFTA